MTETNQAVRLDGLSERPPIRSTIGDPGACASAIEAGGAISKASRSSASALTDDFQPRAPATSTPWSGSPPREHSVATLTAVGSLARVDDPIPALRAAADDLSLLRALAATTSSASTFLDFQLTHETILGADPFTRDPHRQAGCAGSSAGRELKATLVRLRQGYVAAAGDDGLVRDILISTAKGLAPVVRAMLWLNDVERPQTMEKALHAAGARFGVDLNAAVVAERWRYEKPRRTRAEIERTFAALLDTVDRLTTIVDGMKL